MLSWLNYCVNSQTPHASKNKRHKSYFFPHVVTVALSYSKILTVRKLHWPLAIRMTTKSLMKQTSLSNSKTHVFFALNICEPPSPKRQRRTVLDRYDAVTLVFTLISYFAIVVSFILISTDNWFPFRAMGVSIIFV